MLIRGRDYDDRLISIARRAHVNNDTRQIHVDETREMWDVMKDDRYTLIQKRTIAYIRRKYSWENQADRWLRERIQMRSQSQRLETIREKNLIRNKACFEPTTRESAPQTHASNVSSSPVACHGGSEVP